MKQTTTRAATALLTSIVLLAAALPALAATPNSRSGGQRPGSNNGSILVGKPCPKWGLLRKTVYCEMVYHMVDDTGIRSDYSKRLEWRKRLAGAVSEELMFPKLHGSLPFEASLPPGLDADALAERLAKDWTALNACLDFAPEINNYFWPLSKQVGPRTARCNKAVWGVRNAYHNFLTGKMTRKEYFRPYALLFDKYEKYGAVFYHTYCPEQTNPFDPTCTGYPYDITEPHGAWGSRLDYHRDYVGLFAVRYQNVSVRIEPAENVSLGQQRAYLSDLGLLTEQNMHLFEPTYWEVPGCPMAGNVKYKEHCRVMVPVFW